MNDSTALRRQLYVVLLTVAVAAVCGRIFNLQQLRLRGQDFYPTHSSNDRSRWATIRSLVDHGTYVIGQRTIDPKTKDFKDTGIVFEPGWGTVDKVLDPDPDPAQPNVYYFYSSKPPLFSTLLAVEYWFLKHIFGWEMLRHQSWVVQTILLTVNAVPLAIYLVLLTRLVERLGGTDWGRLFVVVSAGFGTFLTTFSNTLNNHTLAACFALFAFAVFLRIWEASDKHPARPIHFMIVGFFAAFAAAVELPALALTAALLGLLLWKHRQPALKFALPAAGVVVFLSFATNVMALGRLTPAYAEFGRGKGAWYEYEGSHWKGPRNPDKPGVDYAHLKESRGEYIFHFLFGNHGVFTLTPIFLLSLGGIGFWLKSGQRSAVSGQQSGEGSQPSGESGQPSVVSGQPEAKDQPASPASFTPAGPEGGPPLSPPAPAPASYPPWMAAQEPKAEAPPPPVETAAPAAATPAVEAGKPPETPAEPSPAESGLEQFASFRVRPTQEPKKEPTAVAPAQAPPSAGGLIPVTTLIAGLTLYLTVVVIGFYLMVSNNYGGNSSGPRWLFWLTPFWLLTLVPVADRLCACRWGRAIALVMLAISVVSASYAAWNPWQQPWVTQLLDALGMVPY